MRTFDMNNATTISHINNFETCTNCMQQFKEGYITDSGEPDYNLIYYCLPCAEIISNLDIDVAQGNIQSDKEYYLELWNDLNFQSEMDFWRNSSYDWGAMEAGKVSYSDYLRQQCGVYGDEDE